MRLLRLGCLLLILLHTQTSYAQPTSETRPGSAQSQEELEPQQAARRKEARDRFVHGLSLAKMGACSAALAEFTASLQLFRTRAALTNSAVCLRELGRFVEARQAYSQLVGESGSSLSVDERAAIETELERLNAQIGEIQVESEPHGAVVVVDAQQRGVTPLVSPVWVDAGTHSVRVFRPGFSALEASVVVAGRQVSKVRAVLQPIGQIGSLVVRESSGAVLNVVVNGAVMGQTPWQGALPPGTYSVALQGPNEAGSAPSAATIRANQTATLVLTSTRLDSEVRVEPWPSNGHVSIDGVSVGNGVWLGRLPSGPHRAEVDAEGFVRAERTFNARPRQREVVKIALVRDSTGRGQSGAGRAYAELVGGLAWAPSLGGSADEACNGTTADLAGSAGPSCTESSHPFGFLAGVRGGYMAAPRIGLELFFGYLRLSESMTRRIRATYESQPNQPLFSRDYLDKTKLGGPIAAISASYRFLERTPITLRAWVGVGRTRVDTSNRGTFAGGVQFAGADEMIDQSISVPEESQTVWLPFAGPELRVGYHLGGNFDADFGVAALLLVPGRAPRVGTWVGAGDHRWTPIPVPNTPDNVRFELPDEHALGTALALVPSLGVRYSF